ncbi:MAG: S8 family serine peptidase, partial [Desulfobacterales bacterium]|nr:S8 family serine peptidase [Desulfobacterales bacterium]
MKLKTLLTGILLFCLVQNHIAWGAATSPAVVRLHGETITLVVENQPLSTILGELSRQGVLVSIDPGVNPTISGTFKDQPVDIVLKSILKSLDYALVWQSVDRETPSSLHLAQITIFQNGRQDRALPLVQHGNLSIVQNTDGSYHVKDILLLQVDQTTPERTTIEIVAQLGGTIVGRYAPLGIIQVRLPPGSDVSAIAELVSDMPGILTSEPDYAYLLGEGTPIVSAATLPDPWRSPAGSEGVIVAVLDSGLLPQYENSPFVKGVYDAISPGAEVKDTLGHGTQMTLVAAGVVNPIGAATQETSQVVSIRAFDDNGFTSNYSLMRGVTYAIESDARVLSLSWGAEQVSPLFASTIQYAAGQGLVLVAAAGNAPTGTPVYPAAYKDVIGVGALSPDGSPWKQSNYGNFVATQALGVAHLPVGHNGDPGVYAGTSISTAYTARLVSAII